MHPVVFSLKMFLMETLVIRSGVTCRYHNGFKSLLSGPKASLLLPLLLFSPLCLLQFMLFHPGGKFSDLYFSKDSLRRRGRCVVF